MGRIAHRGWHFPSPAILHGKASGGGGAWTPASLANLVGWYKADVGVAQNTAGTTPASSNTDPVEYWADQSGNGNHLVSSGTQAAQFFTAAGGSGLNGLPMVGNFNAYTSSLVKAFTFSDTTKLSFFGVFTNNSSSSGAVLFDFFGNGESTDYANAGSAILNMSGVTSIQLYQNSLNFDTGGGVISSTGSYQIGGIFTGTTGVLYKGGTSQGSFSTATAWSNPVTSSIGNNAVGSAQPGFAGRVGEFFICNSDATADLTNIGTYLSGRWGV